MRGPFAGLQIGGTHAAKDAPVNALCIMEGSSKTGINQTCELNTGDTVSYRCCNLLYCDKPAIDVPHGSSKILSVRGEFKINLGGGLSDRIAENFSTRTIEK